MKTCPRCQSKTFDDMEVCYGCLYRFALKGACDVAADESTMFGSMPYPLPAELSALPDGTVVAEVSADDSGERPSTSKSASDVIAARLGADIEQSLQSLADYEETGLELAEIPAAAPEEYCLCIDEGDAVTRYRMSEGQRFVVGRSHACDIEIPDPMVSRRHALVGICGGALAIEDLGASNPTLIDGEPLVGAATVALGACVTIARSRLWIERAALGASMQQIARNAAVNGR